MKRRSADTWRAARRLGALVWVIATAALAFAIQAPWRRDLASRARWLQRTCRRALAALDVEVVARGVPPARAIVAANHLGYLDVLVLAALAPVVFVAKREVRGWPVFGGLARLAGTRFIDRETRREVVRVAAELHAPLAAGVSVALFLEGTSTGGDAVLPFKSSLLEPAVRHGWPVVPAALAYEVSAGHSARDEVCWWGDMHLTPHLLHLAALPRIVARVTWGEPVVAASDRKQLAARTHARVVALHAGGCVSPGHRRSRHAESP